jgi:hypothetical protein
VKFLAGFVEKVSSCIRCLCLLFLSVRCLGIHEWSILWRCDHVACMASIAGANNTASRTRHATVM